MKRRVCVICASSLLCLMLLAGCGNNPKISGSNEVKETQILKSNLDKTEETSKITSSETNIENSENDQNHENTNNEKSNENMLDDSNNDNSVEETGQNSDVADNSNSNDNNSNIIQNTTPAYKSDSTESNIPTSSDTIITPSTEAEEEESTSRVPNPRLEGIVATCDKTSITCNLITDKSNYDSTLNVTYLNLPWEYCTCFHSQFYENDLKFYYDENMVGLIEGHWLSSDTMCICINFKSIGETDIRFGDTMGIIQPVTVHFIIK